MATEMTTDEMLALELEMLESSECDPRKCADCEHSWMVDECVVSSTFPDDLDKQIGWCEVHASFITEDDTDVSEKCRGWKERQ